MANIRINGEDVNTEAIEFAHFYAKGCSAGGHNRDEPPMLHTDDALYIVLRPKTALREPTRGAEARRIAGELEAAGASVIRHNA